MVFFLMRITGDPITAVLGGRLPPDQLQERIHAAGYDRPILVQYFEYLAQLITGNFGTTLSDNRPVTEMLATYGAATLELTINALLVALVVGIPLGLIAAHRRDKGPDAAAGLRDPLLRHAGLLLRAALQAHVLRLAGLAPGRRPGHARQRAGPDRARIADGHLLAGRHPQRQHGRTGDVMAHAVLPALALGLLTAGIFLRLVRTNVIGTLGKDYVEAGRSRGVSEYRLVTKHAYKPALIPIITVMGLQIAVLLGGAVLTETTFEWKGLGFQLATYLTARDFVAVQGIVVLLAVIVAVTNFFVDILAALIDPRVRY